MTAERVRQSMESVLGEREAALALEAIRAGKVTMEAVHAREDVWT